MAITSLYLEADFGVLYTGLSTVGYTLYNAAGGVVVARTTTGVAERGSSGVYGVTVPTIADSVASIVWDTGGGSPVYASEDIESVIRPAQDITKLSGGVFVGPHGNDANTGERSDPVATLAQAIIVANANDVRRINFVGDFTGQSITGAVDGFEFVGDGAPSAGASINLNGQLVTNCSFVRLNVGNVVAAGSTNNVFTECNLANIPTGGIGNRFDRCTLADTINITNGASHVFKSCSSAVVTGVGSAPTVSPNTSTGTNILFTDWEGDLTIADIVNAGDDVEISMRAGDLVIDSTCTAGTITVRGTPTSITDNSTGATVIDETATVSVAPQPSWFDAIYCDPTNGNDSNSGTPADPVLTLAQAITNCGTEGLSRIVITSDTITTNIPLAVDPGGIEIVSANPNHEIDIQSVSINGTVFRNLTIDGNLLPPSGAGPQFVNCTIILGNCGGTFVNCKFSGVQTMVAAFGMICIDCDSLLFHTIDMNGGDPSAPLIMSAHSGDLTLRDCSDATQLAIIRGDGFLELNLLSTISNIGLEVGGTVRLVDGSTGGTINDYSTTQLVDDEQTAQHGAGSWQTGAATQQDIRDAMKLAPTGGAPAAGSVDEHLDDILADTAAMEPNIDAAISSRATQADILSDATPFPGSNIDAAISSRESDADAATRASDIQSDVALENAQTRGFIASEIPVMKAYITNEHNITRADIAALNDPSAADIADAVLREVVADHAGVAGSLAELVEFIHDIEGGRWDIDTGTDQAVFYKADNVTEVARFDLKDLAGNPTSSPSSVTERERA